MSNSNIQEDRVYTFLDGLDDHQEKIRSDVLQIRPFPIVEQAYAQVRKEVVRWAVMLIEKENTLNTVMVSKFQK